MGFKRRKPPTGAAPGTFALPDGAHEPIVTCFVYDPLAVAESSVSGWQSLPPSSDEHITWIDVQGLGDAHLLQHLAERFNIHPLALADVVNAPQRPKSEEYEHHNLFIVRMAQVVSGEPIRLENGTTERLSLVPENRGDREPREIEGLEIHQVGIILGERFVLTIQERHGDILDPIRQRLRTASGKLRHMGADYLAYCIIDTIVDGYFPILERMGEDLDELEREMLTRPSSKHPRRVHEIKSILLQLRRSLWPMREMLSSVVRDDNPYVSDAIDVYFRDAHDHAVQLVEVLDAQKETASGLMNTYLSMVSKRTNEVMKVLTVITTIFIPLTFVVGVYGMNFRNMPELEAPLGYPSVMLFMLLVALSLGYYFYKKGWFHSD